MLSIGNCVETLAKKYRNCFGFPFRDFLSEKDIQSVVCISNISRRERVFSPSVTIWAMLSQVLDSDRACRQVSARVAAYEENVWEKGITLSHGKSLSNVRTGCPKKNFLRFPARWS